MTTSNGQSLPGGVHEQLSLIFTQIGEAQTLDSNGDELGAYRHYLSSVSLTMQVLSTDIQANQGQGTLAEQKVKQLFRMASHCLERGEDIFSTARKEQRPLALFRLATPSPVASPTLSAPPSAELSQTSVPSSVQSNNPSGDSSAIRARASTLTVGSQRSTLAPSRSPQMPNKRSTLPHRASQPTLSSSGGTAPAGGKAPAVGGVTGGPGQSKAANWMAAKRAKLPGIPGLLARKDGGGDSVDGPSSGVHRSVSTGGAATGQGAANSGGGPPPAGRSQTHTIRAMSSYREEAELRNRHVMEQYKALLRKQKTSPTTPVSNEARLSMLRRLEENLSVARIREENIARRLREKEKRAREAEAKAKPAVSYSSLSVDELCDHVTSFEHGKSQITSLKAHLNASDSDPSAVYSAISEILSIMDHPLSRLLGEYQYTIVMTLQPVVSAVEKAGGLPRVDIRLDKDMQTRGSCPQQKPTVNIGGNRADTVEANKEDDMLLLLDDDDDDDNDMLQALEKCPPVSSRAPEPNGPAGEPVFEGDAFDEKLARLKRELTRSSTGGEETGLENGERCGDNGEVYEIMDGSITSMHQNETGPESEARIYLNTGESEPDTRIYQNTGESDPDTRIYQNTGESDPSTRIYQNADSTEPDSRLDRNINSSESNSGIYQNFSVSASEEEFRAHGSTRESLEDRELSNAPMFDSDFTGNHGDGSMDRAGSNLYTDLPELPFSMNRNDSYGTLPNMPDTSHYDVPRPHPRQRDNAPRPRPRQRSNVPRPHSQGEESRSETHPRPLDEAAMSIVERDRNVYEDVDAISKLLRGNEMTDEDEKAHLYETLEGLLEQRKGSEGEDGTRQNQQGYETVDGGMMSRPVPAPRKPQEMEMKKMVVFNNLPPLVATVQCGEDLTLRKLSDTASSVLAEVVKMVEKSFKTLQQCFSSCYPILSSEENQEVCHTVLEASFFPAIISLLTTVYRCKNYQDEVAIANCMSLQVNATPRDLAVRDKYWLVEQPYAPYGEAIDEVRRVSTFPYPSSKLECVVRMSKRVVKCIEEYFKQYHPDKKIDLVGVDDMLPIFSYVILRSGMPELVSECSIMEQFIQEGYIMGEEGFCLTSFLTALRYLINMPSLKP